VNCKRSGRERRGAKKCAVAGRWAPARTKRVFCCQNSSEIPDSWTESSGNTGLGGTQNGGWGGGTKKHGWPVTTIEKKDTNNKKKKVHKHKAEHR